MVWFFFFFFCEWLPGGGVCGKWLIWRVVSEMLSWEVHTSARRWQTHADRPLSRTCTMSREQKYGYPQVFLVDAGGGSQRPGQPPELVPCWSQVAGQGSVGRRRKSPGGIGVSPGGALVVLILFLLIFAGLGFEAYQIYEIEKDLRQVRWSTSESFVYIYVKRCCSSVDVNRLKTWTLTERSDGGSSLLERRCRVGLMREKVWKVWVFVPLLNFDEGQWVAKVCKLWVENRVGKVTQSSRIKN